LTVVLTKRIKEMIMMINNAFMYRITVIENEKFAVSSYPVRHCNQWFGVGTQIQTHDNDGSQKNGDAQEDEK